MMLGEQLQASLRLMVWSEVIFIEVFGCFISKSNTKAGNKCIIFRFIMLMLQTMLSGLLGRTGPPINQAVRIRGRVITARQFQSVFRNEEVKCEVVTNTENSETQGGGRILLPDRKIPQNSDSFGVTETKHRERRLRRFKRYTVSDRRGSKSKSKSKSALLSKILHVLYIQKY